MTDADADRSILVMDAQHNDSMLEPRVADAGHGQQQLAGQETRAVHICKMRSGPIGCKP
jgi:hypothetical protein